MAIELNVQKIGSNLVPVTEADAEVLAGIKNGQGFRVSAVRVSARSLNSHRLYWGGLIRLVADYWEPSSGLVSKYDKKIMGGLIDWIAAQGKSTEAVASLINLYLTERSARIQNALPEEAKAAATLQSIHEWLKEEAGFYDVILTPTGVRKSVKSINFNAMPDDAEFNHFYKKVFAVAWRYVFSRANFANEQQALDLALEMSQMGR